MDLWTFRDCEALKLRSFRLRRHGSWISMFPLFLRSMYLSYFSKVCWDKLSCSICLVSRWSFSLLRNTHPAVPVSGVSSFSKRSLAAESNSCRTIGRPFVVSHPHCLSRSPGAPRHTHAWWWRFPLEQDGQPCWVEPQEDRMKAIESNWSLRSHSKKDVEFKLGEAARPHWIRLQKHPWSTWLPRNC